MKTTLNFEQDDTKKLLAKLDFEFFLKQNCEEEKCNQDDIDKIYISYQQTLKQIKAQENKKQFNYFAEGKVRKMFKGELLPALFELDESRRHIILDFSATGENWAYFKLWQKYYKRKVTKEKIWDIVIKTGSVLAIILSVIKFLEYIN